MKEIHPVGLLFAAAWLVSSCAGTDRGVLPISEPAPIAAGVAPSPSEYPESFDVLHYDISLVLPDTGAFISGETTATILVLDSTSRRLPLDFSGLAVTEVRLNGRRTAFEHDAGKLTIPVETLDEGDTIRVSIAYRGTPDDGLILSRNLHGNPTAFADNWPNRARYWFPSIDHPQDKAGVTFSVRAPAGRQVIANGRLVGSEGGLWRWSNPEPIPTYTMVIGAADFAVRRVGEVCGEERCIDVETWLFPADTARAKASFERADEMVSFFSGLIAPFPYRKLAHVQSSTRFGGMENVSAIFYPEGPLSAGRDIELTVAHETAHQWFGDAVTESDWHHLWLSEGFATYFAALFVEHADGARPFREVMNESRRQYLNSDVTHLPIVDASEDDLFSLLNANNYDKGGWVLHMLRRLLGDEAFFVGIRDYYRRHEHATALTDDLREALQRSSGRSLEEFFRQWVFSPGHPQLRVRWSAESSGRSRMAVEQVQPETWPTFTLPLEVEFEVRGETIRRTIDLGSRSAVFDFDLTAAPSEVRVDPDGNVLHELLSLVKE